jgi:BNR repeat-like domain
MKIIRRFVVYQGAEPALFPGLARAANGDLLVSYCTTFDCQPGGEAYVLRSCDEGHTWSDADLLVHSRKTNGCINLSVGMTTLRDGTVLYPCCDACITRKWDQHDADLIILRSTDHGQIWTRTAPIPVKTKEPFAYGKIIELKSEEVLCPIWGKRMDEEPWRSGLIRSLDKGVTWGDYRTIAYDPGAMSSRQPDGEEVHAAGFNETSLLELPDGRLLAILRQQGVQGGMRELYRSASTDGGGSWSTPKRLSMWGTSPSLHLTPSGAVILGYRNHLGNPQGLETPGVGVSVSHDAGETWGEHFMLEDPKGYRYLQEFEAGYPAFLTMQDGSMMVVFYSFDPSRNDRYLAGNILSEQPTATSNN